ncbi:MAG: hypothetical protein LBG60_12300 [Bifidobacteriaceae bacterium]|nr:hypothetical protein [Bifidobacteriaceae bacterium]
MEHFTKVGLKLQVESAPTNFSSALESGDSELARQMVKDPHVFEHLAHVERITERDAVLSRPSSANSAPASE